MILISREREWARWNFRPTILWQRVQGGMGEPTSPLLVNTGSSSVKFNWVTRGQMAPAGGVMLVTMARVPIPIIPGQHCVAVTNDTLWWISKYLSLFINPGQMLSSQWPRSAPGTLTVLTNLSRNVKWLISSRSVGFHPVSAQSYQTMDTIYTVKRTSACLPSHSKLKWSQIQESKVFINININKTCR